MIVFLPYYTINCHYNVIEDVTYIKGTRIGWGFTVRVASSTLVDFQS